MFQNNNIFCTKNKKLHSCNTRVEGIVKKIKTGFIFLEVKKQKNYIIPSTFMKKVMHGDKIIALLYLENNKEFAEPETLIKPSLTRFIGQIKYINNNINIIPNYSKIHEIISAQILDNVDYQFKTGDWAIAEMKHHPLKGYNKFYANITALITTKNDRFAQWLIILARHNLEYTIPDMPTGISIENDQSFRKDLTSLNFITIDDDTTEDIDDALYIIHGNNGSFILNIAISDLTIWVKSGNELDKNARKRAFTNYLPGFDIPMLPYILSHNLCSLREYEKRPVLVCEVIINSDGTLSNNITFFKALIQSKAKLSYKNVSDWLENIGTWNPMNYEISEQINLLYHISKIRIAWRKKHELVFKHLPEYHFIINEFGNVQSILLKSKRIAHQMIEEAMIAANICAAKVLKNNLGFGIYNVHDGFDHKLINEIVLILKKNNISTETRNLSTLHGFCSLRRQLDNKSTAYLNSILRRFYAVSEISNEPKPHFGLGLDMYATWTSPIRKYGDIINHRLLKSLIEKKQVIKPSKSIILHLSICKKKNRMAERDINNLLYKRFLRDKIGKNIFYSAEIITISYNGIRVRLLKIGAIAFIPAYFIHNIRDELSLNLDIGIVTIKDIECFRQGDTILVKIIEIHSEKNIIIANIVIH